MVRAAFAIVLMALSIACTIPRDHVLAAAARRGDLIAIEALLRSGADPNEPSGVNNWTPVMHAIHKNQAKAAFALIDQGADVNRATEKGRTALMMAAGYGQEDIVRGLLDRRADPRLKDSSGETALDWAVTGVTDIDAWTAGKCQTGAVKAILDKAPDLARDESILTRSARTVKRCPEVQTLLDRNKVAQR